MTDVLAEIRYLHRPDIEWFVCLGCDFDGDESWPPTFPCRTADLLYTAEEIADFKRQHDDAVELRLKNRPKFNLRQVDGLVQAVYSQQIQAAMRAQPIFRKLVGEDD